MQEDKSQLMNYAMFGGLFLGLFWVVKYFFVIGSNHFPAMNIFASLLSIATPIFLIYYLVKYRSQVVNSTVGYWHGVQFGIMLFFFASILEAIAVFIHITWIDTTFIANVYTNLIETVKTLNLGEKLTNSFENQPLPSALNYVVNNVILSDVFVGLLLSLLIVPIANKINSKSFSSKLTKNNG